MPEWRTRKRGKPRQVGKHFIVPEKGDKRNLPTNLRVVSIPESSELHPSMREKVREEILREKEKQEKEIERFREKLEEISESAKPEEGYTEEELISAGIEELGDRGLELGEDYTITDDDKITVITEKRGEGNPLLSSEEKKGEEFDWWEAQRRKSELRRKKF